MLGSIGRWGRVFDRLGVLRMPDAYNRIQTGTKATTLGTILVLIGLAFLHPGWALKLVILIFFVMLTNPVSSHALARAVHAIGIRGYTAFNGVVLTAAY